MNPAQLGSVLRAERERSGLSLSKISRDTNISQRHLEAIEADQLEQLPTGAVGRGFVKQYAGYLGLDPDEFSVAWQSRMGAGETAAPPDPVRVPKASRPRTWLWASVGTLSVLLILGVVGAFNPSETETPKGVLSDLAEVTTGDGGAVSAGSGASVTVKVDPDAETGTWIEVLEDGRRTAGVELMPGESRSFIAESTIFLVLGNPDAVQLIANGRPLGKPEASKQDGLYRATFTASTVDLPITETPAPSDSPPAEDL